MLLFDFKVLDKVIEKYSNSIKDIPIKKTGKRANFFPVI